MRSLYACFVLGCRDRSYMCARHRHFGLVAACQRHDPSKDERCGSTLYQGEPQPVASVPAPRIVPGGALVSRQPTPPPLPNSPGFALDISDPF